ncbi:hypothetical protein BDY21DRAFT_366181 [Lineolata rhizophorae]|uniref:Inhibitor I9 domain-containing protein n=1 Tax=Lineolata rhizophorae TaxID=578093 RepID=A0A6A6NRM2_9PEZI|nr:hypothetical protein BDY21DRAFT_366181 [Lineolata rhizophorae]
MKILFLTVLLALLAASVAAVIPQQKPVLVTYPEDTPAHVLDEAKHAIMEAGGFITHEYHLIKGFAATAPSRVIDTVRALGAEWNALVEVDGEVHAMHENGGRDPLDL